MIKHNKNVKITARKNNLDIVFWLGRFIAFYLAVISYLGTLWFLGEASSLALFVDAAGFFCACFAVFFPRKYFHLRGPRKFMMLNYGVWFFVILIATFKSLGIGCDQEILGDACFNYPRLVGDAVVLLLILLFSWELKIKSQSKET